MKGDFSRVTFDARRHYTRVLRQQGRVDLDADHNEESAILEHLQRTRDGHILGRGAAPYSRAPGFEVGAGENGDLTIAAGTMYVDGLLCEATAAVTYLQQPDLPDPERLEPEAGRVDLVYLDVWQRHVSALEDEGIREVALGGPDTTTRVQTVWQVRVRTDLPAGASCAATADWPPEASGARLTTGTTAVTLPDDPCLIKPGSGYRGVENHLYRVEIHKGGGIVASRFKWSRDNASVAFAVTTLPTTEEPRKLELDAVGKDRITLLRAGDWVELVDDDAELQTGAGLMAKVEEVDESLRLVHLDRDVRPDAFRLARHPRLRRWDQSVGVDDDGLLRTSGGPTELEAGVTVDFSGEDFRVGDHWMFAARTGVGRQTQLENEPPHGIHHHYSKLAIVTWTADGDDVVPQVHDCRSLFPALTELTRLDYVGGDGQEVMPDPAEPLTPLPHSLRVGVSNGEWPVSGARVKFLVHPDAGELEASGSEPATGGDGIQRGVCVVTGDDGTVAVTWKLRDGGEALEEHRVVATLVDDADQPHHLPIHFSAKLSVASNVAYDSGACASLADRHTVQEAMDTLRSITRMYRVSGEGQMGMPGATLSPLEVVVANDCGPVPNATVGFEVAAGGGTVSRAEATTDVEGRAACTWSLGPTAADQQVRATLLDAAGNPVVAPASVSFHADLALAGEVAYDPTLATGLESARTVQEAIDRLSHRTSGGCCTVTAGPGEDLQQAVERLPVRGGQLCLSPGTYDLRTPLRVSGRSQVTIVGAGPATVLRCGHEVTLLVTDCSTVEVCNLRVESGGMGTAPGEEGLMGAVTLRGCTDVHLVDTELSCRESRSGRGQSCLAVHGGKAGTPERTRIEGNRLEVGANQVGMLVVGPRVVDIVGNHLVPGSGTAQAAQMTHVPTGAMALRTGFQQGIVVAGSAGVVRVTGNVVEQAVQGIHIGAWADREGPITSVTLDGNTVVNRIPAGYGSERHAVYVSNSLSTTITNTTAHCVTAGATDTGTDAVRVLGDVGPYLRVVGLDAHGYTVGVRVAPRQGPGENGQGSNMWFVGDVLASGARSAAEVSSAVRTGILVVR